MHVHGIGLPPVDAVEQGTVVEQGHRAVDHPEQGVDRLLYLGTLAVALDDDMVGRALGEAVDRGDGVARTDAAAPEYGACEQG